MGADLAFLLETQRRGIYRAIPIPALERAPASKLFSRLVIEDFEVEDARAQYPEALGVPVYSDCGRDSLLYAHLGALPSERLLGARGQAPVDISQTTRDALGWWSPAGRGGHVASYTTRRLLAYIDELEQSSPLDQTLRSLVILREALNDLPSIGADTRCVAWCW